MLYQGNDLILKDSNNGTVLAASKSLELNINDETIEVGRTSGEMWRKFITGRKDWSVSVSTLVSAGQFKASVGMIGKIYGVKFVAGISATTALLSGTCICKQVKITDQKGSVAKGSFVFQGTGALS